MRRCHGWLWHSIVTSLSPPVLLILTDREVPIILSYLHHSNYIDFGSFILIPGHNLDCLDHLDLRVFFISIPLTAHQASYSSNTRTIIKSIILRKWDFFNVSKTLTMVVKHIPAGTRRSLPNRLIGDEKKGDKNSNGSDQWWVGTCHREVGKAVHACMNDTLQRTRVCCSSTRRSEAIDRVWTLIFLKYVWSVVLLQVCQNSAASPYFEMDLGLLISSKSSRRCWTT